MSREMPPIRPRLRVELSPGSYLRTARADAFVAGLLDATFGAEAPATLPGRTATGDRPEALGAEARGMADLFVGLASLSSEDIGHRLDLAPAEVARLAGRTLTGAGLRAICDQHRTRGAIRRALGAVR